MWRFGASRPINWVQFYSQGPCLSCASRLGVVKCIRCVARGQPYIRRPVLRFRLNFKRLHGTFYDFPREDLARVGSSPFVECTALVFLIVFQRVLSSRFQSS